MDLRLRGSIHGLLATLVLAVALVATPVAAMAGQQTYICYCGLADLHTDMLGHTNTQAKLFDADNTIYEEVSSIGKLTDVTTAGNYMLGEDQTLSGPSSGTSYYADPWFVPSGETVLWTDGRDITFDFSGYWMQNGTYAGIYVSDGDTLTISGYSTDASRTTTISGDTHPGSGDERVGNPKYCAIYVGSGGTLNLYGVTIDTSGKDMSGIYLDVNATVNIYEGATIGGYENHSINPTKITGNDAYGIQNWGGTVNIYGGEISNNGSDGVFSREWVVFGGGGSYVNATVNMYGGTIKNNGGSGIHLDNINSGAGYTSTLNMYGGTITGNGTSSGTGGGVYIEDEDCKMVLHGEDVDSSVAKSSGSAKLGAITITGNKGSTGPNVYVNNTSTSSGYNASPRISVIAGSSSALRSGSTIGIAIGRCANSTKDEDYVTSNADTPGAKSFFTSDVSGYGISTKDGKVTQVKTTAAPASAKETITTEYTGSDIPASVVDDGTTVDGSWSWKNAVPHNTGTYSNIVAVFTPDDIGRYSAVEKTVTVTVTKKPVTVMFTVPGGGTYGGTITPTFATPVGVASGDDVQFTLTYTGTTNGGASYNSMTAPTEAGTYTVTASISNSNYQLSGTTTVQFVVARAPRSAPAVTATDETISGKADGTINGLTTDMEVSADNGSTYTAVTDTNATYAPGTYIVRYTNYAESANYEEAPSTTVTIASGRKLTVTLPSSDEQVGYTLTASPTALDWQGTTTFTFTLADGYSTTDDFKVTYKEGNATSDITGQIRNGSFTVTGIKNDVTVSVSGVADATAPDVTLSMRGATWKDFVNAISFGLFFKDITPSVTAADVGSGIASAEYLLTSTAISTEADAKAATGWQTLTLDEDGKASITMPSQSKKYLYVRVTDAAGNVKVVGPDKGVVVYTDSTANTADVTYTKTTANDVTAQVNLSGNYVDSIANGDATLVAGTDYTVDDNGKISFKASYLDSLAAGDYTLTVSYNPQGETYTDYEVDGSNVNDKPATTTLKLGVVKQAATVTNIKNLGKTYDGTAVSVSTADDTTDYTTNSTGALTVEYKAKDADDSTYSTEAPKDAGSYTVRVSTAENGSYTAASATADFTIAKKGVTITGTTVEPTKTYDGTTAAAITSPGTPSENYDGENLSVVQGTAAYSDKNAGTGKSVTFSGFSLTGSAADNYSLTAQPAATTADIAARTLTVDLTVANKVHDGLTTADYEGTPALVNAVEGDDVTLAAGTPTFPQTAVGENLPIVFTPFSISGADADNYVLAQPAGITANITAYNAEKGTDYTVNSSDWINEDFVVSAADGHELSLTGEVDGDWVSTLSASDETDSGELKFYVKNTATGALSEQVVETYKIDKTAPTGTAKLSGSATTWSALVDPVSFDATYTSAQTLTASATDELSGVAKVEYHVASAQLSTAELEALGDDAWTALGEDGYVIPAEDGKSFVCYVRITDEAGNVSYISTDGATYEIESASDDDEASTTKGTSASGKASRQQIPGTGDNGNGGWAALIAIAGLALAMVGAFQRARLRGRR